MIQIEIDEPPKFKLHRASKLTSEPKPLDWAVKGYIERASINLLFGPPASGKSLIALDWSFCVAAGIAWNGQKVKQAPVVIIAGEGFAGLARRLKALESKYGMNTPEQLFISEQPGNFADAQNAAWVAESIKAICPNPGLVVIDTMHRNMVGDENSAKDIGQLVSNLDNHIKPLGCAVLIVHHSGHGEKDRGRGSSAIRAAMDAEYSAVKLDEYVVLSCNKAKDFEPPKPIKFCFNVVPLDWRDEEGEPLTSAYLNFDGEAKPELKKRKLSARDDAVLTALSEAIDKHGVEPTGEIKAKFAGPGRTGWRNQKVVNIEHWRAKSYKVIVVDGGTEKAKRTTFWRVRNKLLNQGLTVEYDNFAWRIF
ncbi:AAA family ATPase [Methylotuvimicrobium buryatense]|uniref:AAA family ATPase n=1 Tax=Methylotuvimicrobium buryatense TaxID=95641 RepID=A0A4P9UTL8_METBY|nr:AAA family ATPase [Methylotuvimicrobium buryatense]